MAISVMFYGLGPIGAAVARQVATRKGFKIAGGIDIDPAKLGQDLGDVIGLGSQAASARDERRGRRAEAREARCRGAVHELVAAQGDAADRDHPQGEDPDRQHDRGTVVSGRQEPRAGEEDRRHGAASQGRRARHRRQSRVRHGRAADRVDRRVRARGQRAHRSRAGRARAAAAVPAEDRLRPDDRAVPEEGRRPERPPRRAGRVGHDDCRRLRLEAGQGHRRDQAEDRRSRPSRASSSPSIPAMSAASSRTASAGRTARRSSRCTWRRISVRPRASTRS